MSSGPPSSPGSDTRGGGRKRSSTMAPRQTSIFDRKLELPAPDIISDLGLNTARYASIERLASPSPPADHDILPLRPPSSMRSVSESPPGSGTRRTSRTARSATVIGKAPPRRSVSPEQEDILRRTSEVSHMQARQVAELTERAARQAIDQCAQLSFENLERIHAHVIAPMAESGLVVDESRVAEASEALAVSHAEVCRLIGVVGEITAENAGLKKRISQHEYDLRMVQKAQSDASDRLRNSEVALAEARDRVRAQQDVQGKAASSERALRAEVVNLQQQLASAHNSNRRESDSASTAARETDDVRKELAAVNRLAESLRQQVQGLDTALNEVTAAKLEAEAIAQNHGRQASAAKQQLESLQGELQLRDTKMAEMSTKLNEMSLKLHTKSEALVTAVEISNEKTETIARLEKDGDEARAELRANSERLMSAERDLGELEDRQNWKQLAVESATSLLHPIRTEIDDYDLRVQKLLHEFNTSRARRIGGANRSAELRMKKNVGSGSATPLTRQRQPSITSMTSDSPTISLHDGLYRATSESSTFGTPEPTVMSAAATANQIEEMRALGSSGELMAALDTLQQALLAKDFEMRKALVGRKKVQQELRISEEAVESMRVSVRSMQDEWRSNMMELVQRFANMAGYDRLVDEVYNAKVVVSRCEELNFLLETERAHSTQLRVRCTVLERHLEAAGGIVSKGPVAAEDGLLNDSPGALPPPGPAGVSVGLAATAAPTTMPDGSHEPIEGLRPKGFLFGSSLDLPTSKSLEGMMPSATGGLPGIPGGASLRPLVDASGASSSPAREAKVVPTPTSDSKKASSPARLSFGPSLELVQLEERVGKVTAITDQLNELETSYDMSNNGLFRQEIQQQMVKVHGEIASPRGRTVMSDAKSGLLNAGGYLQHL